MVRCRACRVCADGRRPQVPLQEQQRVQVAGAAVQELALCCRHGQHSRSQGKHLLLATPLYQLRAGVAMSSACMLRRHALARLVACWTSPCACAITAATDDMPGWPSRKLSLCSWTLTHHQALQFAMPDVHEISRTCSQKTVECTPIWLLQSSGVQHPPCQECCAAGYLRSGACTCAI